MTNNPPVREMVKQSVKELGGRATNTQIRDAILARFPTGEHWLHLRADRH